ncbi:probable phosphoserine aminotransferase [Orussus abietinus]|uniref:probable phosphoserine aminotransferase n=1 Tax=Orussus abietinus TaxID=222816 RepID=UPI0006268C49|nr:probable phosphoserine aminotransferase [Orussus abietinus]
MSKVNNTPKVINFGAGPAKLPEEVLKDVQKELLSLENAKVSILELSHRSNDFKKIIEDAQASVRSLLNVPDNYKILFMQGGGTGLFAAVPLNLMYKTGSADYIVTGSWSAKAAKEAAKYGKVNMVLAKQSKYTEIPDPSTWNLDKNASYVYYCSNETVHGIEFNYVPETNGIPLVADMSSNIFTKPLDISKFGVIFAGAQKNFGPSGITLVIVRDDLLGHAMPVCPTMFDFAVMDKDNSIHNTPPTFQIYVIGKIFHWLKKNGGVEGMEKLAIKKSEKIYRVIEESKGFYTCPVQKNVRSRMNIPFRIRDDEELENKFLAGAAKRGMLQLKGHRSVGGIRASLYNAVTEEETEELASYMTSFFQENSK